MSENDNDYLNCEKASSTASAFLWLVSQNNGGTKGPIEDHLLFSVFSDPSTLPDS